MKRSFVPHAPHAEAVGAIIEIRRGDVVRDEIETAHVFVGFVVRQRGPIVAVEARVDQLAANVLPARSRKE